MKLITERGMIFGKVNIIDLFVVLFIIAIIGLGFVKLTEEKGPVFVAQKYDFEMQLLLKNLYGGFEDEISVGDKVYDDKTGNLVGEVTDVDIQPAKAELETADGQVSITTNPARYDVIVTVSGTGTYSETSGLVAGGESRYVADGLRARTNNFVNETVIYDINVEGE